MPETARPVLDKRLIDRMIRSGKLSPKDVEKLLKSLDDKAGDAVPLGGPNSGASSGENGQMPPGGRGRG